MDTSSAARLYASRLDSDRQLSPHTIRAYKGDIAALVEFLGDCSVHDIAASQIRDFIAHQRSMGLSEATVRRRVAGTRAFFRWLDSEHHIRLDPTAGLDTRFAKSLTLPKALSDHELRLLLAAAKPTDCPARTGQGRNLVTRSETTTLLAVALMVATGLRVGELVSLTNADTDLHARTIRVLGKGRRERVVYLTDGWVTDLLRDYRDAGPASPDSPLLQNRFGEQLTTNALRQRLHRVARSSGLRRPITPHMLRHTAATQLIEAGVDIRFVQKLLGHASIATTEIYTHVADSSLRRVVDEANILETVLAER